MRRLILGVLVLAGVVSAAPLAQVEIDRVLRRIEGHPITTRDVYAARELKLVAADSDAAALAALEDRRLKLLEIARIQQGPPGDAEVAARRRTWDASFTGPDDRAARLNRAGLNDAQLTAWLADDVRIAKYEDQRFAGAPDRTAAITRWVQDLRRRYGLPPR